MVAMPMLAAVKLIFPAPLAPRPIAVLLFTQLKTGLLVPEKVTVTGVPEHTVWLGGSTTVGAGLMVMLKLTAVPEHVPITGVAVIVAICCVLTPAAIKFRSPLPLAASPMLVLLFVQLNVAPAVPENGTITVVPPQAIKLLGWFMVGAGVTVIVKFWATPGQPFPLGVTIRFPVVGLPTLAAVKLILPLPLAPRPMATLEFVQLKLGFPVPLKLTTTIALEHTVWLGGSVTVGTGFIVMVKIFGAPGQPFSVGVTVMVATS